MEEIPPGKYKYTDHCYFVAAPEQQQPFFAKSWLVFGPAELMPMGHVAEVTTRNGEIMHVQILEYQGTREVHKRNGEMVRYALATWDRTVEENELPTREDIPAALVHLLQFADDHSLSDIGSAVAAQLRSVLGVVYILIQSGPDTAPGIERGG